METINCLIIQLTYSGHNKRISANKVLAKALVFFYLFIFSPTNNYTNPKDNEVLIKIIEIANTLVRSIQILPANINILLNAYEKYIFV